MDCAQSSLVILFRNFLKIANEKTGGVLLHLARFWLRGSL